MQEPICKFCAKYRASRGTTKMGIAACQKVGVNNVIGFEWVCKKCFAGGKRIRNCEQRLFAIALKTEVN